MGGGASTTWRELGQETTWRELGSSCRIGFGMPWRCCWSNGQWLFKMLGRRNRIGEQNRKGEAAQWHARMCGNSSRSLNVFSGAIFFKPSKSSPRSAQGGASCPRHQAASAGGGQLSWLAQADYAWERQPHGCKTCRSARRAWGQIPACITTSPIAHDLRSGSTWTGVAIIYGLCLQELQIASLSEGDKG